MKRKVNLVGNNTLTVSLPKKWTEKYNLKKGDELDVVDEGAIIKLVLKDVKEEREIVFNLESSDKFVKRVVFGPFLKGYKSITYNYKDPLVYTKILGTLNNVVGFEIVEQKEGKCKLEEISSGSEENFNKLIIRLFYIMKSFLNEVQRFLKNPYPDINDLSEIENECDKISLYCRRLINKNIVSGKTYDNTAMYYIICLAEQIGDQIEDILDFFKKEGYSKYKYDLKLDRIFEIVNESIEIIIKKVNVYLVENNSEKQLELTLEQKKLGNEMKKYQKYLFELKKENGVVFHYLSFIMDLIKHMSEELF